MSHMIYLGLGSNLNDPVAQLKQATDAIAALAGVTILKSSPSYRNPPLDTSNSNKNVNVGAGLVPARSGVLSADPQPDYVNKVLAISTTLSPEDLLIKLQAIEIQQGRPRDHGHWLPRTIDIDILLYDNVIIDTPHLTLPHPGLTSRAFVVLPLLAIAPDLRLPNGQYLLDYRHQFPEDSLHELH